VEPTLRATAAAKSPLPAVTRRERLWLFLTRPLTDAEARFVVRATLGTVVVLAAVYVAVRP